MYTPIFIYRLDFRGPTRIFRDGFQPRGTNTDFFRHILGLSLSSTIAINRRSHFISASDSPDSAIRFYGGVLTDIYNEFDEAFLYEIEADQNTYSAMLTANNFLMRINNNTLNFIEGNERTARRAITAALGEYASQREWFSFGAISNQRIRGVWRVDTTPIDSRHIRHQGRSNPVVAIPRINSPQLGNPNYVANRSHANEQPWDPEANILVPTTVEVPDTMLGSDVAGGVEASLGFACAMGTNEEKNNRSKRDLLSSNETLNLIPSYSHCFIPNKFLNGKIGDTKSTSVILSSEQSSKIYLKGQKSKTIFQLGTLKDNNLKYKSLILLKEDAKSDNDLIYDVFQRISWPSDEKTGLGFSLTMQKTNDVSFYEATIKPESTNSLLQKWEFINIDEDYLDFKIKTKALKEFYLCREISTNKLCVLKDDHLNDNYEQLYLTIDKDKTDYCILFPQSAHTKLVDISLGWEYQNLMYSIIPESGFSVQGKFKKLTFFYDLITKQIIYVNDNYELFALYNKRGDTKAPWDWVEWVNATLEEDDNTNKKWFLFVSKFKSSYFDYNFRQIRSYTSKDYLRVIISGPRWGSLYTLEDPVDQNSISLFIVDEDSQI